MSRIAALCFLFVHAAACAGAAGTPQAAELSPRAAKAAAPASATDGAGDPTAPAGDPTAPAGSPTAPAGSPTAPAGGAFPQDEARTALRAAEGGLRSCNDGAVPRSLEATIRFEPSGKVSDVDVAPADDRAASCVRSRLRDVSVVPFTGEPVTVRVSVTL
ncbi:MAG: hypothetical protein KF764_30105 [Labilithrix sp.]|nr:hypothetical protein [Labilithrix sp.]